MNDLSEQQKYAKLQEIIAEHQEQKGPLMPVMQAAQELFGYLPLEVQNVIAEGLKVPLTEVYGVATFYSQFSLEPTGEHTVSVCLGTACYVKGAQAVVDKIKSILKIEEGKTTEDGKFTLLGTRCLGCCGLAPVLTVDSEVYGRLAPADIADILAKY